MTEQKVKDNPLERFQKAKAIQILKPTWCFFDCLREVEDEIPRVSDLTLIAAVMSELQPSRTRRGSLMVFDECIERLEKST